jgi:alkylation response protein AidB-like acyl-CoA dehydrogenase
VRTPAEQARAVGAEAAVVVAQARYLAVESALAAAELLFDVGGGSATDRSYALDRHWRNARTVANRNPRDWKAAVVGAYYLAGEEPPTTGLFLSRPPTDRPDRTRRKRGRP